MRLRPACQLPLLAGLLAACGGAVDAPRYIIYHHARITEDEGRRPTDPDFGIYEYDAILDSLRATGAVVLSEQRPSGARSDSFAAQTAQQVDSLLRLGVPPEAISVVGFSKGGWIAILASARLQNPEIGSVFLGACRTGAFWPDRHLTGRHPAAYQTG